MSDDTRDRVIALEVKVEHLTAVVEQLTKAVKEQMEENATLFQIVEQAKGARWLLLGLFGMLTTVSAALSNWQSVVDFFTSSKP